ncbi:MAG: hypothetical protein K5764_03145 [Prevotella sp.]|nr:hypothetical protein [Prevotella sp.]
MNFLTSKVLMSIFFAASFTFTACSDDLQADDASTKAPENADTALLEPYGLTFENFITDNDVQILNADTTEIAVSKALAEKLGITTFVNHPMGIWHKPSQLPYTRKATAEKLVGDRYILTVKPATVAEIIGNKKVTLNTGLYVNPDPQPGAVTRAGGLTMPDYAAKYMDEDNVIHPAVIQMTGEYDYAKGYHTEDDQPQAKTRSAEDGYQYMTADELVAQQTRASIHRRILAFKDEIEIDKNFQCGDNEEDSINVNFVAPMEFELNYFLTLDGAVKWHFIVPEPYVDRFEAGIDGKFAFSPELKIGFKKEWKLDEDKWKKTLATFNAYTFTFWVGPVPVSIKCEPEVFMKIDGKVTGQVYMGMKYEYENNFRGGIRYTDRDGWSTIKEFNEVKNELTFIRPEAQVKAEAGIGIYLGMNVMIYGVAGPEVAVGPRLGAEAELTVSPFAESFDEKLNFKAEVGLTVNAVVGAKLKVLGYELAEYTKTIYLAGPWTLWKYPSDGTEHICGEDNEITEQWKNFFEAVKNYSNEYTELTDKTTALMMEMDNMTEAAAKRKILLDLKSGWSYIPSTASAYSATVEHLRYIYEETTKRYKEYQYQQHAEAGDMEWINAENWKDIFNEMMSQGRYAWANATNVDEASTLIHQWFLEEFNREPSLANVDDLTWLQKTFNRYNEYKNNRQKEAYNAMREELRNANADLYNKDYDIAEKAAVQALQEYWDLYGCVPAKGDTKLNQMFRKQFEQLYNESVKKQEDAANKKEQEQADAEAEWAKILDALKQMNSDDFKKYSRQANKAAKSARSNFKEKYNRDPRATSADIDIINKTYLNIMKMHR